jgi:hypothetical protein
MACSPLGRVVAEQPGVPRSRRSRQSAWQVFGGLVKQMSDDPATEKPGSAGNCDEPAMAGCAVFRVFCHGRQPACPPARFEPSVPHEVERLHLNMFRRPSLSTSILGMNVERTISRRSSAHWRGSKRCALPWPRGCSRECESAAFKGVAGSRCIYGAAILMIEPSAETSIMPERFTETLRVASEP